MKFLRVQLQNVLYYVYHNWQEGRKSSFPDIDFFSKVYFLNQNNCI